METLKPSAIERLVDHYGGPVALSRKLGGDPSYQAIQIWVKRRWASPMHIDKLERILPRSIKRQELHEDRTRFRGEKVAA